METHKIDQFFKQKLERSSEPVSADAFAQVQAQMKQNKRKKGFPWMIAASISILVALSLGAVYKFTLVDKEHYAQIDLKNDRLSFSELTPLVKPEIKNHKPVKEMIQKVEAQKPVKQSTPSKLVVQDISRMASIERVNGFGTDLKFNKTPELRLAPQVHENTVIVELHYQYAGQNKTENIISKSNDKLKSLASEFSLSELRSAKNDLFASALQLNKRNRN